MKSTASALALTLAALAYAAPAIAAPRPAVYRFDQPSQPLARALLAVSERTGVVVLAPTSLVGGRVAPALSGVMTLSEALRILLAGARLDYAQTADGTIAIVAGREPPLPSAARRPSVIGAPSPDASPAIVAPVHVVAGRADQPLSLRRLTAAPIDLITEEELARSAATSLGDALQQLPGAAALADGGETRQVAVRGLGGRFTRVRVNGMETLATFGGANAGGGTNRGRAFDYNVFAADLFKQIRLQKTASAEIDEGSLGATVDVRTRSAFDFADKTALIFAERSYNTRARDPGWRTSAVLSRRVADDRLGLLISAAYSQRQTTDTGTTAGQWQSGDALFPGFGATTAPQGLAAVNAALHARIPRLELMEIDQRRLGLTASAEWRPSARTRLGLDLLYSTLKSSRDEYLLETFTFRTAGACGTAAPPACGLNATTVSDATLIETRPNLPVLIAATFDGVDIKSEARHDELETIFRQVTLSGSQDLGRGVQAKALVGFSRSDFSNPVQQTLHLDQYDTQDFRYDFRDRAHPLIDFGDARLETPSVLTLSEFRSDPNWVDNSFKTASFDLHGQARRLQWQAGLLHKAYQTDAKAFARSDGGIGALNSVIPDALAAVPTASYVRLAGEGLSFGSTRAPDRWLAPDVVKAVAAFRAACLVASCDAFRLGPEPVTNYNYTVAEQDDAAYAQLILPARSDRRVWGDIGLRWVRTAQESSGLDLQPSGALSVARSRRVYRDLLPSFNLVWEPRDAVLLRFGAARVMARPDLRSLRPGLTISTTSLKSVSSGNPDLHPTRAVTLDGAVEWYFAPGAALSLSVYDKSISSTIQSTITRPAPFWANPFGLPDNVAMLACRGAVDCSPGLPIWQFIRPADTGAGSLRGFELAGLAPLGAPGSPLGDWRLQGAVAYTRSSVLYRMQNGDWRKIQDSLGGPRLTTNLSLAYRGRRFEARAAVNHRSRYLLAIPATNGGDVDGVNAVTTVDASARLKVSDRFTVTLDGTNLTNAAQRQFTDTSEIPNYQHRVGREFRAGGRFSF